MINLLDRKCVPYPSGFTASAHRSNDFGSTRYVLVYAMRRQVPGVSCHQQAKDAHYCRCYVIH
jgi:hypothetical protein